MQNAVDQLSRKNFPLNRSEMNVREKERIMERVFQSSVYKEFLKQWSGIVMLPQKSDML